MISQKLNANVHESLCNENVIVSDFISGTTIDDLIEEGRL